MIASTSMMTARQLPEEFEALFREHSDFVYRTAYRVTGSAMDAEDIVQSLFLKLLRQRLSADIQSKPRAYLYRAAVNTALNLVRSRKHEVLTGSIDDFESRVRWQEPGRESTVHEHLRIALAELKPRAAEIFILRYVHGYTDAEIGALLGTSRGTIAISLFRSRSRLRKSIRRYLGEKQ